MSKPAPTGDRLQKHLASLGVGSRREIEKRIEAGEVTVNGRRAQLGDRYIPGSQIRIDGRPVRRKATTGASRVILYNKPEGEISTRKDPAQRQTVFANLPKLKGQRWVSVGRLDVNTQGLMLFTSDGDLANRLMHPSFGLEREYHCRVYGDVTPEALRTLTEGVDLGGETLSFKSVKRARGEGRNTWYTVVVEEGRYREVRRLWQSAGCQLSRLIRVRYGPVRLPRSLRPGHWEELAPAAVQRLLEPAKTGSGRRDRQGRKSSRR